MFPVTWSHGKIMHAVSDVIVNNKWIQESGKAGSMFTKRGAPVNFSDIKIVKLENLLRD